MAGLSVFMKRRIQQLVEEYQDPHLVLEQLQNAAEDMTEQDEEEIVDYLSEISPAAPYGEMSAAENPMEFLQQLFGRDSDFPLPGEDAEIMDEMLDMVESGIEEAHYTALSFLEEIAEEKSKKIQISGIDLSPHTDIITSLPIIKDFKTLLEVLVKDNIQLKLTKSGDFNMNTLKKVHAILSESPFIKGTKLPRKKRDSTYLMVILNLLESTGFFSKKDSTVFIPKSSKKLSEILNFNDVNIYWKLFKTLFFKEEDSDFFNLFGAFGPHAMEFSLLSSLLSIGEEWRNFDEAVIPILTEGNLPLRHSIAHVTISQGELGEFIMTYGYWLSDIMEKMAIWETRKDGNDLIEIRLTQMGKEIIEEIFSIYPVPCQIYGNILACKSASNYINYQISTGRTGQMKIRNSEAYDSYVKVNNELDNFYLEFIESVLNPNDMTKLINKRNKTADILIGRMTDSITGLKNFMKQI